MTSNRNYDISTSPQGPDLPADVRQGRKEQDNLPPTIPLNVAVRLRDVIVDVPSEAIGTLYKLMKELGSLSLALAAIAAIKLIDHLQNNIKSAAKTAKH